MVAITREDVERFEADGVIKIESALPTSLLERLERAIDPYLAPWRLFDRLVFSHAKFFTRPNVWKTDPFFFELAQRQVFPYLAAELLRSKRINLLQDQIFVKRTNCRKVFGWHHDRAYAPIEGRKMVSFWMATERITLETGGLQFIRGSHLGEEPFARPELLPLERLLSPTQAPRGSAAAGNPSRDGVVAFDLDPGDVLAFHGRTLHRSAPNESRETQRTGYALRYVGDDVTYRPGPDVGITYDFWDSELSAGDPLGGPLFPLLYDGDAFLARSYGGPERMELLRIVKSQLRRLAPAGRRGA